MDGDIILVDGAWYVKYMPQDLIDATKNYRVALQDLPGDRQRKKLSKEERQALNARLKELKTNYLAQLESRGEYRLTHTGFPTQTAISGFTFPKPGYMAFDPATGKLIPPRLVPKLPSSITIQNMKSRPDVSVGPAFLRSLRLFHDPVSGIS